MPDETNGIQSISYCGTTITSADAAEFLNERAAGDQACPVCKQVNWLNVFGYDGGCAAIPAVVYSEAKGLPHPDGTYLPTFAFACGNCGNIRLHSLAILETWVKEKGGQRDG